MPIGHELPKDPAPTTHSRSGSIQSAMNYLDRLSISSQIELIAELLQSRSQILPRSHTPPVLDAHVLSEVAEPLCFGMTAFGTFETCRPTRITSVHSGRPKVVGTQPERRF